MVTGANGYLGSAVCSALLAADHDVIGLVRRGRNNIPAHLPLRVADILDRVALTEALTDIDAVCHLAGLTRARDSHAEPLRYFEANTVGTLNLLRAMASAEVRRLVFASTGSIYGTPDHGPVTEETPDAPPHPYAASKHAAEAAITAQAATGELSATILRLFNIVGGAPTDDTGILPRLLAVAAGELPRLPINGDGSTVRDYLHIRDAADAFPAALRVDPGIYLRYNISRGIGVSINDLVAATSRVTGLPIPVEHRDAAAESQRLIGDSARAARELGWTASSSSGIDAILREAWTARFPERRMDSTD
nr:NAD-dependent epimerase/dehydratase family protein [Nocardia bovistercoris]